MRRIITSKKKDAVVAVPAKSEVAQAEQTEEAEKGALKVGKKEKRVCFFCKEGKVPSYTDTQTLRKFLSDRGKIQPRLRTGACAKHQRKITLAIKHARHLSLLPFTPKV